jgi:hypothetical protein
MAYATIDDLEARYGEVPLGLRGQAEALLGDAATILDARVEVDPTDEQQLERLRLVSCAMVNRALMAAESEAYGISDASYTMGPFTQSATFANPSGDLYLTKGELALLGVGGGVIVDIRARVGGAPC